MHFFLQSDPLARRRAALLAGLGAAATVLAFGADGWLVAGIALVQTDGGRQAMLVLTWLGNGVVDLCLAAALAGAGRGLGRPHLVDAGLRAAVAVATAGIAVQVVKHLACRARPGAPASGTFFNGVPCLGEWGAFSFPSGHAATATALALALGLRVPALRIPAAAGALVVLFSRVYLGAHFPSDVLAGATLGVVAAVVAAAPGRA